MMDQFIATLFSILFTLVAVAFGLAIGASAWIGLHLGVAPRTVQIVAIMAFAPLALLYLVSYRAIVIAPVLRRWAAQNGVALGKIRRRTDFTAPPETRVSLLMDNQYLAFYSADVLSPQPGTAYFRLLVIAPFGIAVIRASTIIRDDLSKSMTF
ncbi:hypothetical protein [Acidiphilium sp. MT5]